MNIIPCCTSIVLLLLFTFGFSKCTNNIMQSSYILGNTHDKSKNLMLNFNHLIFILEWKGLCNAFSYVNKFFFLLFFFSIIMIINNNNII